MFPEVTDLPIRMVLRKVLLTHIRLLPRVEKASLIQVVNILGRDVQSSQGLHKDIHLLLPVSKQRCRHSDNS